MTGRMLKKGVIGRDALEYARGYGENELVVLEVGMFPR